MKKILLIMTAMLALAIQSLQAQAPLKIVTNHPDFKIKVQRCAASGKTVIIDLILTNEGATDVEDILGRGGDWGNSEAYDSDGNIYQGGNIQVRVANRARYSGDSGRFKIPTGVPMRFSVCLENVPLSVESIARLSLVFECQKWGLNKNKPVKISNIPISRD